MEDHYYCLGNPINCITPSSSHGFFNAPTLKGISPAKMEQAFEESKTLILCHNLEDAKALRAVNIVVNTKQITTAFYHKNLAEGYPLWDYVIYEIVVKNVTPVFHELRTATKDALEYLVNRDIYLNSFFNNDRSSLPDIEICPINTKHLIIELVCCYYGSLMNEQKISPLTNPCLT